MCKFSGLDASVSFDIIHSLRRRAQRDNLVVVAALLQPTPEVYAQFDEIILLREGQVLYHGPRTELPRYLKSLGFEVPTTKTQAAAAAKQADSAIQSQPTMSGHQAHHHDLDMADFLSEFVFMPHKGLPEAGLSDQEACPPLTTSELAAAWKSNPLYQEQMSIDDSPIELKSDFAQAQYGTVFCLCGKYRYRHLSLKFVSQANSTSTQPGSILVH
jgi:ABC-type multidrug transport system ATPase subunit